MKRKNTKAHRLFSMMIVVTVIYMVFDMLTVYTINHVEDFSFTFNHFVHIIYMAAMCTDLYIVYMYIRTLALDDPPFRKRYLIPLAVAIAGAIFLKFDYVETPYGNYSWGSYAFVVFASGYLYFFAGMVLLFRRRKYIEIKSFRAIYMALLFQLAAVIVQGIFPTILISGMGLTVIVVSLFYSVESPDAILIEKLADERIRADSANKAKSMFLAQMSHDIRTPMNAVLGMNEMILRKADDPEILEYASSVRDSGSILLSIINEILDFSKIEDGKMEILSVEYDTARLIASLINSVSGRAASKGLLFYTEIDETIPCRLRGDDVRFTQVVMNLLTNAVKYTEEGSVTLTFRMEDRKEGEAVLFVSVEDTGIGIRAEDMDKLMASFSRIEEERNRHVEGTGLGMSIVDRLLKMMGSSIQVESEYGKGSKFSFIIRQGIVDDTPMGDYRDSLNRGNAAGPEDMEFYAPEAKVLVVDDNEMNLKVAWNLLKLCGISPVMVSSGEAVIEDMRKKQYDIVFLDHMMPGMDGIETLRRLKEENLVPEHTAVIALTANAVVGARETYLAEGFADYLSKPIEVKDMVEKLKQYLPEKAYENMRGDDPAGKPETLTGSIESEQIESEGIMEFAPAEEDGIMEFEPEEEDSTLGYEDAGNNPEYDLDFLKESGMDVDAGLSYCGGEQSLYFEMLRDFTISCKEKLSQADRLYLDKNWHEYEVAVHAMKSNAKMIGAISASELAKN
ncbi:MAG: response regulator, partial [Lachnospiraceae bacterium]|nr:response regulator [Lachnospiraceae bacterium]